MKVEKKSGRKHYLKPFYWSSLPVQEIELDQEINLIEEEIAKIQEQKKLLKRTAIPTRQYYLATSSSDSELDHCSHSLDSSSEDDQILVVEEIDDDEDCDEEQYGNQIEEDEDEDEDEYLPHSIHNPSITSPKNLKRKRSKLLSSTSHSSIKVDTSSPNSNTKRKKKEDHHQKDSTPPSDSSPPPSSSPSSSSSTKIDIELQFSICTLNSPPKKPNSSNNNLLPPSSQSTSSKKKLKENVFEVEEVVTIQTNIPSKEEDEDIDILN